MLGMNLVFKFTWQNNLRSIVDIDEKSQGNLNFRQGNVREFCYVPSVWTLESAEEGEWP